MSNLTTREAKQAHKAAMLKKLTNAADNLKLCAADVKAGRVHRMRQHAADAMVNLVELCDMEDKEVISHMFKRLKQLDRMDD